MDSGGGGDREKELGEGHIILVLYCTALHCTVLYTRAKAAGRNRVLSLSSFIFDVCLGVT